MILAIVQARMGSSRLPGKILYKYKKKTFLEILIDRLKKSKTLDKIVVATSYYKNNDVICELCKKKKINFFRGSEHDVLSRYYNCAKKYNATLVVRITADCPLVDPYQIDKMINIINDKKLDFVSNTVPPKSSRWPDGSDIEIFNFKSLIKAYKKEKSKNYREHVTFHFWKGDKKNLYKRYQIKNKKDNSKLRYTLDYKEDLILLRHILNHLDKNEIFGNSEDIINYLYNNQKLIDINSKYQFGMGWYE